MARVSAEAKPECIGSLELRRGYEVPFLVRPDRLPLGKGLSEEAGLTVTGHPRNGVWFQVSCRRPNGQEIYYLLLHIFISLRPGILSIYRYIGLIDVDIPIYM